MIEVLENLIPAVVDSITQWKPGWDSLIINRRKPWTYRAFRQFGKYRVCLHAFEPCESKEAFAHPHPWPGAFLMLKGSYVHSVGYAPDLVQKPEGFCYREIVRPHSMYEITDRRTFHSVQPLERTYTMMVNGTPWENPHAEVRTTKGKDLDKMSDEDLRVHLLDFVWYLNSYRGVG